MVMARLADDVFAGLTYSDSESDDWKPDRLAVGDLLTWLIQIDVDGPQDGYDSDEPADDSDEPASPKPEEIVSLRVEQIRNGRFKVLGRSTVVRVSIGGHNFSFPVAFGRASRRARGAWIAVTLSGVDVARVTPPCALLTDST
jgi:hypothetical protein